MLNVLEIKDVFFKVLQLLFGDFCYLYFVIRNIVIHMAAGLAPPDEGKNLNSRSERNPQQKRRLQRGSEESATRLPSTAMAMVMVLPKTTDL